MISLELDARWFPLKGASVPNSKHAYLHMVTFVKISPVSVLLSMMCLIGDSDLEDSNRASLLNPRLHNRIQKSYFVNCSCHVLSKYIH